MTEYPLLPLDQLKAPDRYSMVGGPFGSKLVGHDYVADGVPVIRGTNLPPGARFSFDDLVFVSEEKVSADLVGNLAFPGDLVVTQRGTLGQIGLIPATCPYAKLVVSQSQMKLTVDEAKADALYVYYAIRSPHGQHEIHSRAIAAGVPHINLSLFKQLRVPVPPLPTQRRIAAILSAYDDLIENNNWRIKILEETARRIYREWFVDFRYPGHENAPLVRSAGGPLPHGWTVGHVGDIAKVIRGRSYHGTEVGEVGGVPFINLKCIARGGGFRRDGVKRFLGEFRQAHAVRTGDIVMAVTDMTQERRIVARAARIPDLGEPVGVASMDLVRIEPVGVEAEFLLGLLQFSGFADSVKHHANGANVLHLHPDRITQYQTVLPPTRLMGKFAAIVGPLDHLHDALESANASLRRARDLLVPRLISGEIDVEGLNIEVSEAAA